MQHSRVRSGTDHVSADTTAYDEFLKYVHNTPQAASHPSEITLVKVTPLNQGTAEYALPGPSGPILTDPSTDCSGFPASDDCPTVSLKNLSCDANETTSADAESFTLNGTSTPLQGVGTQIGVQTMINLSGAVMPGVTDYCTAAAGSVTLGDIFNFAVANGTQFIEVTPDLAAGSTCYSYIKSALVALSPPPHSSCLY